MATAYDPCSCCYVPSPQDSSAPSPEPDPNSQPPVPNNLRPVPPSSPPCYLPQPEDAIPSVPEDTMGVMGPSATGVPDWSPLAGLIGTRPVVDRYSIARYGEKEWRRHNKDILDMSTEERDRMRRIDWNARQCVQHTASAVNQTQADNTQKLRQKEQELHRWKCELEAETEAICDEIALTERERCRLIRACRVLQIPESIAAECIEARTGRWDKDLVRDDVEDELIKERALAAEIREEFTQTLEDTEAQLVENRNAKQRLEFDWSDKTIAHEIEALNISLTNTSNTVLFQPGSVTIPKDQSNPEFWTHFTEETLNEAKSARQRSEALRATLDAILMNAARDLRSQADRVDIALSTRVARVERMLQELEHELKKVLCELANVEPLMIDLRNAIRRMDFPMKTAQTRLDNRLRRPRVEHCRDVPQSGILDEVKFINDNVDALQAQLKQSEACQVSLITARNQLEREILIKRKTLDIDKDRLPLIRAHYPSANALSGY